MTLVLSAIHYTSPLQVLRVIQVFNIHKINRVFFLPYHPCQIHNNLNCTSRIRAALNKNSMSFYLCKDLHNFFLKKGFILVINKNNNEIKIKEYVTSTVPRSEVCTVSRLFCFLITDAIIFTPTADSTRHAFGTILERRTSFDRLNRTFALIPLIVTWTVARERTGTISRQTDRRLVAPTANRRFDTGIAGSES